MRVLRFLLGGILSLSFVAASASDGPVLDMHLHTTRVDSILPPPHAICVPIMPAMPTWERREDWETSLHRAMKEPQCDNPVWSANSDDELMHQTIAEMRKHGVVGVLGYDPEPVARWHAHAPDRFIQAVRFAIGSRNEHSIEDLRALAAQGRLHVLGEVENQYYGVAPDDSRMEPYWALMEELDIPVAYHMGSGPPGAALVVPTYRVALGDPLLLEPVLAKHPNLRISVMHYGEPFIDEMIAMMGAYPQLYLDIGGIAWLRDKARFYREIQEFIDAGFAKRIMFGSDQMAWPGLIGASIKIIEEMPTLSDEQKRDIFYNNAARFLRLPREEIDRHHALAAATKADN
jgi:uncharacterized protein